jgi:phosphate-selective porin
MTRRRDHSSSRGGPRRIAVDETLRTVVARVTRPRRLVAGFRAAALCTAVALLPGGTLAADSELVEMRQALDALLARQDTLESENTALRQKVATLETRSGGTLPAAGSSASVGSAASAPTSVGLNKGGGGYFIRGEDYSLRLRGYSQVVGSVFDSRIDRADGNGDFSIRRARIDFLADLFDDYQIFIEFDGGVGNGATGVSDFALVEARLNWRVMDEAVQLRMGKFTSPFSAENFRSSRDIDTIERYIALNSLFGLPAFDTQTGAMIHGTIGSDRKYGYYLGVFNGNGRANDNFSDDNDNKDVVAKVTYAQSGFSAGLAFDYSDESPQMLGLSDLAFNRYVAVPVEDRRVGMNADVYWEQGPYSFRAEGVAFRFDSPMQDNVDLFGGFIQPAVFVRGGKTDGLQLLFRGEVARIDADTGDDGDTLLSATLGASWFLNSNVRVQVNGILQYFDGSSQLLGLSDRELIPLLMTEVQFKF